MLKIPKANRDATSTIAGSEKKDRLGRVLLLNSLAVDGAFLVLMVVGALWTLPMLVVMIPLLLLGQLAAVIWFITLVVTLYGIFKHRKVMMLRVIALIVPFLILLLLFVLEKVLIHF